MTHTPECVKAEQAFDIEAAARHARWEAAAARRAQKQREAATDWQHYLAAWYELLAARRSCGCKP